MVDLSMHQRMRYDMGHIVAGSKRPNLGFDGYGWNV